ncbi:MAG: hypothetical protein QOE97_2497 [Pseudonocardiales bacterium]|jgi:hypothetical protein|nr:hypothetical protein [Pseudonocardiales bacterium]
MAKRVITTTEFTDDLDGSRAEGTVAFALEGKTYEIDLSRKNAAALRKAMKPYIDSARAVRGSRSRSATRSTSGRSNRSDLEAIRTWARDNGYQVADRGRISAAVIEAYQSAH